MNPTRTCNPLPLMLAGMLAFPAAGQDPTATPPPTSPEASALTAGTAASATNNAAGVKSLDQETRDLKPRDALRFAILEDPARSSAQFGRVDVSDLGDALFPISSSSGEYINVKAAGRRLADVRREVKERLEADYYHTATVSVDVLGVGSTLGNSAAANVGKVYIFGSISYTIPLPEDRKRTLSEVFVGLPRQEFVNLKKVQVFRWDAKAQKLQPGIFKNVQKMLNDGDLSADIELNDGDRIKVVDKGVIF